MNYFKIITDGWNKQNRNDKTSRIRVWREAFFKHYLKQKPIILYFVEY